MQELSRLRMVHALLLVTVLGMLLARWRGQLSMPLYTFLVGLVVVPLEPMLWISQDIIMSYRLPRTLFFGTFMVTLLSGILLARPLLVPLLVQAFFASAGILHYLLWRAAGVQMLADSLPVLLCSWGIGLAIIAFRARVVRLEMRYENMRRLLFATQELGRLSHVLADGIHTPLQVILTSAFLVEQRQPGERAEIHRIRRAVDRVQALLSLYREPGWGGDIEAETIAEAEEQLRQLRAETARYFGEPPEHTRAH